MATPTAPKPKSGPLVLEGHDGVWIRAEEFNEILPHLEAPKAVGERLKEIAGSVDEPELFDREARLSSHTCPTCSSDCFCSQPRASCTCCGGAEIGGEG